MSHAVPSIPDGELIQGPNARGGNLLFRVSTRDGDLVLKLYRRRKARWRAPLRHVAHFVEGKRGTSPHARCETERETLEVWQRHGFLAPRLVDRPCPQSVEPPFLWMTWLPGVDLRGALEDAQVSCTDKAAWMRRLAASMSFRHTRALEAKEPLLIPEHPHVQHVLVDGPRVAIFDHEGGYTPRYPLRQAIAAEFAGTLRSALRAAPGIADVLLASFVDGYDERARARSVCDDALDGGGLTRRFHRWDDRRRRPDFSKMKALRLLRKALEARDIQAKNIESKSTQSHGSER